MSDFFQDILPNLGKYHIKYHSLISASYSVQCSLCSYESQGKSFFLKIFNPSEVCYEIYKSSQGALHYEAKTTELISDIKGVCKFVGYIEDMTFSSFIEVCNGAHASGSFTNVSKLQVWLKSYKTLVKKIVMESISNPPVNIIITEFVHGTKFHLFIHNLRSKPIHSFKIELYKQLLLLAITCVELHKRKIAHQDLHFGNIFVPFKSTDITISDKNQIKWSGSHPIIIDLDRSYRYATKNPLLNDTFFHHYRQVNRFISNKDIMEIMYNVVTSNGMHKSVIDDVNQWVFKPNYSEYSLDDQIWKDMNFSNYNSPDCIRKRITAKLLDLLRNENKK